MATSKLTKYIVILVSLLCLVYPWSTEGQFQNVPIQTNFEELFMYWVTVQVGTPAINFTVVLDTGSSDLLVPSSYCDTCAGGSPKDFYNTSQSSTYSSIPCDETGLDCTGCVYGGLCEFQMPYVGITEDAMAARDVVDLGKFSEEVIFGAILNVTFDSSTSSVATTQRTTRTSPSSKAISRYPEGMLGLAFASLNTLGTPTLLDYYVQSGQMKLDVFSMCLLDGQATGVLQLGGYGRNASDYQFTPILRPDYYRFEMKGVLVNGKNIGVNAQIYNSGNCIVDSGTPVPTLPLEGWNALKQTFLQNCSQSQLVGVCKGVSSPNQTLFDQVCFAMTAQQIQQFPTIQFVLAGSTDDVVLSYPPESYLMKMYYCQKGQVGLALSYEAGWTIVGARLLQLYNTAFDRDNMQVGFAPAYSSSSCGSFGRTIGV